MPQRRQLVEGLDQVAVDTVLAHLTTLQGEGRVEGTVDTPKLDASALPSVSTVWLSAN